MATPDRVENGIIETPLAFIGALTLVSIFGIAYLIRKAPAGTIPTVPAPTSTPPTGS